LIEGVLHFLMDFFLSIGCVSIDGANVSLVKSGCASTQQHSTQSTIALGNYAILVQFPCQKSSTTGGIIKISSTSYNELTEWSQRLQECCSAFTPPNPKGQTKSSKGNIEKSFKIAQELSNLIVYCRAVAFAPDRVGNFTEMSSFPETKVDKWLSATACSFLLTFNQRQFTRVYPKGSRLDSSNYDPTRMWNVGVQMAAINYQTADRAMQLNYAKFALLNGGCGYVLKPELMFDKTFNPYLMGSSTLIKLGQWAVNIRLICARHLTKSRGRGGVISPFVEVEIVGTEYDNSKYKSPTISKFVGFCWKSNSTHFS